MTPNHRETTILVYSLGFEKVFGSDLAEQLPEFKTNPRLAEVTAGLIGIVEKMQPADGETWLNFSLWTPYSSLAGSGHDARRRSRYLPVVSPLDRIAGIPYPATVQPDRVSSNQLETLKAALLVELAELAAASAINADTIRFLASKYLSAVGMKVGSEEEPYPLFDILKVAAALLTTDSDRYSLAALDISGIQNFVYNISSAQALKSLRGRSLFLEVVAQMALRELLESAGCTLDNLLIPTGGYYLLLLPALDPNQLARLHAIISRWNRRWLALQEGRVFLAFSAYAPDRRDQQLSVNDLLEAQNHNYTSALRSLREGLSGAKSQKFVEWLGQPELNPTSPGQPCPVCRREVTPGSDELLLPTGSESDLSEQLPVCQVCRFLIELGQHLAGSRRLEIKINTGQSQTSWTQGRQRLVLAGADETVSRSWRFVLNPYRAVELTGQDFEIRTPLVYSLAPHLNSVQDVDGLAQQSQGWRGLGALRADLDNLGQLLKASQAGTPLLAQTSLSRQLTLFFADYITWLAEDLSPFKSQLKAEGPRYLEMIYGGGDDLFCLGAWHDIVEFSLDLGRAWQAFSGQHPTATISVGFSLHSPKFPVAAMADSAGRWLEQAKANQSGLHVKDSLASSLYPRALFWQEIFNSQALEKLAQPLYRLLIGQKLNRAFLRRLLEADSLTHGLIEKVYNRTAVTSYPVHREGQVKLLYTLASLNVTNQLKEDPDWTFVSNYLKTVHANPQPPQLHFFLGWLDLLVRAAPGSSDEAAFDNKERNKL